MTLRRQYSPPNCTLILEDVTSSADQPGERRLMSTLTNAECHFAGQEKPLAGGRDFFESLVRAVSYYAQEFLSGVPRPPVEDKDQPNLVHFKKVNDHQHRLSVQSSETTSAERAVDLTTVQLFDLVEAVDQFLADSSTLPDLSLTVAPVSKRYAKVDQPIAKRAAPAALGVSSLALAAVAFFFTPVPEVRTTESTTSQPDSSQATPTPSSPLASVSPTPSPTPTPTPSPTPTPTKENPNLEALLTSAPEINDPTQLRFLQRKVYEKVDQAWATPRELVGKLEYRVGVGQDGEIVGYRRVNGPTGKRDKETPLPDLLYIPATGSNGANKEPIAQFRVVFTNRGVLQVSPWGGYKGEPRLGKEITDPSVRSNLNDKLYNQLRENWSGTPSYTRSLEFRVAVNEDGVISDYEPANQPAFDYVKETPLPTLIQTNKSADKITQEPLAQYKVVFKPSGVLEVGPWPGS